MQNELSVQSHNPAYQLVPINATSIAGTEVNTVNARDLYAFLESKQEFANWIKNRIEDYGFIENQDYIKFLTNLSKTPSGGRPAIEYYLTIDMAKELSMVERTDKGKEARKYFIECEKRYRNNQALTQSSVISAVKAELAAHEFRLMQWLSSSGIRNNPAPKKKSELTFREFVHVSHLTARALTEVRNQFREFMAQYLTEDKEILVAELFGKFIEFSNSDISVNCFASWMTVYCMERNIELLRRNVRIKRTSSTSGFTAKQYIFRGVGRQI